MQDKVVIGARYIEDDNSLENSSSGGIFFAIAKYVVLNGGVVYGAAFDENNIVKHFRVDKYERISELQGSKYVQSYLGSTFVNVKSDLESGIPVLFSGTPCQIAGLSAFLKKEYQNLITMDFTCHGVPSPMFFKKYLVWLEEKMGSRIEKGEFTFRTKRYGWYYRRHMSYMMKIKNTYKYVGADPYYANFLKGIDYRESCYSCPFKLENHKSDITVGDFNGVDKEYPKYFDKRGVSYIIINNIKGKEIIDEIQNTLTIFNVDYNVVLMNNHTLSEPVKRPKQRDTFYKGIEEDSFVRNKDKAISLKSRIKPYIPYFLEKLVSKRRLNGE